MKSQAFKNYNFISKFLLWSCAFYCTLFCLSFQFPTAFIFGWMWDALVPYWASILGEADLVVTRRTGSGDTIFNYYKVSLIMGCAVISGLFASFTDINKEKVTTLRIAFFLLIRYYIIAQMLIYGFSKALYLQFQFPTDMELEKRLGDKSPMGLLWSFMGYSKWYTMFTGWLELLGAIFLYFRRTILLGILLTLGVMMNVMMLNYCYDVPVKILSTHLVLFCFVLMFPLRKEIWNIFFTRDSVQVRDGFPFFDYKESGRVFLGFKIGVLAIVCTGLLGVVYNRSVPSDEPNLFKGKYRVTNFTNSTENDSPQNENETWDYIRGLPRQHVAISLSGETSSLYYELETDTVKQTLIFRAINHSTSYPFTYQSFSPDSYHIEGIWNGDSLSMNLHLTQEEFLLKKRKFQWIQEYPFNR